MVANWWILEMKHQSRRSDNHCNFLLHQNLSSNYINNKQSPNMITEFRVLGTSFEFFFSFPLFSFSMYKIRKMIFIHHHKHPNKY